MSLLRGVVTFVPFVTMLHSRNRFAAYDESHDR